MQLRPCQLVGMMLVGLLPTNAFNPMPPLDPARLLVCSPAVAFAPGPLPATRHCTTLHSICRHSPATTRCVGGMTFGLRSAADHGHGVHGQSNGIHGASLDPKKMQQLPRKKILVTGGAGYIGSHICADLLLLDYDVVVFDNFANSSPKALERAMQLGGRQLTAYEGDTRDLAALRHVFESELTISSVIHLAGLKAVGESVSKPTMYYDYNVAGSINLMQVMSEFSCKQMVFSSSATVYGETKANPIKETEPLTATSPYGRSKLMVEDMLRDQCRSDKEWGVAILRYFNPVGAHPSGLLGEDPKGIPNNLMPFITKVATGAQPELKIFGNDYATKDGTGVRDYLHVMDLSQGHIAAIRALDNGLKGAEPFNLGTGIGISVLEMVSAFGVARGEAIPYSMHARRPGDVAECYADASKALNELGWKAHCSVEQMCRDVLTWTRANPDGFGSGSGSGSGSGTEIPVRSGGAGAVGGTSGIKAPAPPLRSAVAEIKRVRVGDTLKIK